MAIGYSVHYLILFLDPGLNLAGALLTLSIPSMSTENDSGFGAFAHCRRIFVDVNDQMLILSLQVRTLFYSIFSPFSSESGSFGKGASVGFHILLLHSSQEI